MAEMNANTRRNDLTNDLTDSEEEESEREFKKYLLAGGQDGKINSPIGDGTKRLSPGRTDEPKINSPVGDVANRQSPIRNDEPKSNSPVEDGTKRQSPIRIDVPKINSPVSDFTKGQSPILIDEPKRNSPANVCVNRQSPVRSDEPVKGDSRSNELNFKSDTRDQLDDELSDDDDDFDRVVKSVQNQKNSSLHPQSNSSGSPNASESRKDSPVENEVNALTRSGLNASRDNKPESPFRSRQYPITRSAAENPGPKNGSASRRSPSSLFSDRVFVEDHFAPDTVDDSLESILHDARSPMDSNSALRDEKKPFKSGSPSQSPKYSAIIVDENKQSDRKNSPIHSPNIPHLYSDSSDDEQDIVDGKDSKNIYPPNSAPHSHNSSGSLNNQTNSINRTFQDEKKRTSPRINDDVGLKPEEEEQNIDEVSDADDADFREIFLLPVVNRYRQQPFNLKFMESVTAWAAEDLSRNLKHLREKRELIVERQKGYKNHPLSNNKLTTFIGRRVVPRDYLDGDDLWATESDAIMSAMNLSSIKPCVLDDSAKECIETADDCEFGESLSPLIALENNAIHELISRRKLAVRSIRAGGYGDGPSRPNHADLRVDACDQNTLLAENIALWRRLASAHKNYAARLELLQADGRKQAILIKHLKNQIDFFEKEMSILERKCHRLRRSY